MSTHNIPYQYKKKFMRNYPKLNNVNIFFCGGLKNELVKKHQCSSHRRSTVGTFTRDFTYINDKNSPKNDSCYL